jgi:hypothetical protein
MADKTIQFVQQIASINKDCYLVEVLRHERPFPEKMIPSPRL